MTAARRPHRPFVRRGGVWWIATILLLLAGVVSLTGKDGAVQTLRLRAIRADLASEVDALATENRGLRTELASLRREDPAAVERRAREDLGMVRPGEIRIDFREPGSAAAR